MLLTDNETKVDLLNNEAIATTIINLLCERPDRPVTLGVHGDWGAGKSSILEMIEAGFEDKEKTLCIKFNGWRFQGFEDAKIALIEGIVTGLLDKRPLLTKATDELKRTFKSIDWLKLAKKGGGLAWTAFSGIPTPDQIQSVLGILKGFVDKPTDLVSKENIESAVDGLKGFIKTSETKHVPEEIQEFRKAFDELLRKADVEQLVVLIDDLDRCLPDTAIETLEAIRLFVFTERTAFVVAADEAMIEYSVRKHFPELPETTGPRDYARNYLEKLIQIPFRIPALGETETRTYVSLLLIGAKLGDNDPDFSKLIVAARERLRRPWITTALDASAVKKVLGDKTDSIQDVLRLSDQISPILANGTKGNPRQIKRFLNALILRERIAEARGFGEDIKLPLLAKLMLAERFLPALFDQIASAAAVASDGICTDINQLEAYTYEKSKSNPNTKLKPAKKNASGSQGEIKKKEELGTSGSVQLSGWISSEAICSWAALEPQLTDIDLRPYLFVAKDRKDYFGSTSALGKLATVVENLLEAKIIVQGMTPELKQLAEPEAVLIFEEVRSRIIGKGSFELLPPGVDGLKVLVTAHPHLEPNVLDLLDGLPTDRLGVWVVQGWDSVLRTPENRERFQNLLSKWASINSNPVLKAAASSTLAITKTKR